MSNLEDLLKKLKVDIEQNNQHYVYYDDDSKKIYKISPKKEESAYKIFSIDSKIVDPILQGIKRLDDFYVYFDYASKLHSIKERILISNFSSINLIKIDHYPSPDLSIVIKQDKIIFDINSELIEHLTEDQTKLVFVITENNNPYKLYNTFEINTNELLDLKTIDHHLSTEQLQKGVSMYTNPIFGSYSLKVDYDN